VRDNRVLLTPWYGPPWIPPDLDITPNWTDDFGGPLKPGCQASARPARSAGTALELGTICSLHSRSHLSNRIGTFVQYGVMPWYHQGHFDFNNE
jgi:hypothetical protein